MKMLKTKIAAKNRKGSAAKKMNKIMDVPEYVKIKVSYKQVVDK